MPHLDCSERPYTYVVNAMTTDPHTNEYLAAVAGMADVYGTPTYAIGDRLTWRLPDWGMATESGRVIGHQGTFLVVQSEDDHTKRVINPLPWPTGHVMPY